MTQPAIRVSGLAKRYTVVAGRAPLHTLRDEVSDRVKSLLGRADARPTTRDFWALHDVTFDVQRGEVVGVIGRNGAGKSTLLKLLARITEPTRGFAEIHGRVGSLLEVGTGFDMQLSGRENIFLSGAILGMRQAEIRRKFDDIVAFAEVERFIDTPIKRYSSGMFLRLAFAVAAHLESEILLLDEVLAVGDANFQRRCLGKMEEVAGDGRTILFVSHNLGAISRFCHRTVWIDKGTVREHGDSETVVGNYLASGVESDGEATWPDDDAAPGSEYVRLLGLRVRNQEGEVSSAPDARHPFTVEVEYRVLRRCVGLRVGVTLFGGDGSPVIATKDLDCLPDDLQREPGRYVSRCEFPGELLNYGHYYVSVGSDTPHQQTHFRLDQVLALQFDHVGGVGGHFMDGRPGVLRMRLPWRVESLDGGVAA